MIVIIEKNENGKYEFTKEELQVLLEQAREEGRKDAKKRERSLPIPREDIGIGNGQAIDRGAQVELSNTPTLEISNEPIPTCV